ncbi:MAG: 4Fe-4S dicluster domain-containing protein [Pyrobaculum sp.]
MSLQVTRREVVKSAALAAVAVASPALAKGGRRWAMYIDVSKCYGCYACVTACAAENNVPIGVFRTWVERHELGGGAVVFVPKQCNHCENPSCVKACPTGATYKTEDGLVLVEPNLCIGCGACIQACPYGARFFNPITGVADKCTFCSHRIYTGKLPACVEICPTGARVFGDLNDPHSEISRILAKTPTQRPKVETGNEPMFYYRDLPQVANA